MSDANAAAASADTKKNENSKPVFMDKSKDVAVFLNTRTIKNGPKAGTSFDVYTYTQGRGAEALRVDVPTRWGNHDLRNDQKNGFSDVVDLVEGNEVLVTLRGKPTAEHPEGREYDLLIGGLPIVEKSFKKDDGTEGKFRTLPLIDAFVSFHPDDKDRAKPRFFTIENAEGKKVLSCQRFVGPMKIYLADAVAARDAIAAGQTFSLTRDGVTVPFEGIAPDEKSKTAGMMRMNWGKPILQNQGRRGFANGNEAPLPQHGASQGARSQSR